ncbi:hypothetical protein ES703_66844 [subsurface metagenome]
MAPKALTELLPALENNLFGGSQVHFLCPLYLRVDDGRGEIPHGHRFIRMQSQGVVVGRQELINIALLGEDYRLNDMGEVKAIEVNHHRQQNLLVFGNTKGTEDIIHHFLPVFGKELNPAGIADGHSVGVVTPDAQGGR